MIGAQPTIIRLWFFYDLWICKRRKLKWSCKLLMIIDYVIYLLLKFISFLWIILALKFSFNHCDLIPEDIVSLLDGIGQITNFDSPRWFFCSMFPKFFSNIPIKLSESCILNCKIIKCSINLSLAERSFFIETKFLKLRYNSLIRSHDPKWFTSEL